VLVQHPLLVPFIPLVLRTFAAELESLNAKVRVDMHLLFGYRFSVGSGEEGEEVEAHPYDFAYPVNALRNLATDESTTELVFNMDCDFLPSSNMHGELRSADLARFMRVQSRWQMAVFVVPAFETVTSVVLPVPFTREKLDELCENLQVIPFHSKFSMPENLVDHKKAAEWCAGRVEQYHISINDIQGPTNYTRWLTAEDPFQVILTRKKLIRNFEPYVVGQRSLFPRFDERFRGYSFNKRTHMIEMQFATFDVYTLPHVFITHRKHEVSSSKRLLSASVVVKETVKRTYDDYVTNIKYYFGPRKLDGSLHLFETFT